MYRKVKRVEWISFKSAVSGRAQPVGWRSSVLRACAHAPYTLLIYSKGRDIGVMSLPFW